MKNKNNGITLIALVITIIVMLILVSVTISMAINGGLFEYAGRAVSETENAIDREQILANGGIVVNGVQYNSIDDFLDNKPAAVHNWTRNGDTFTCSHCDATYTMGDIVYYTPTGNTSATITAEKSGYGSDQTIKKQDATWIVLGIEDTDGNGTNETLLITTQAPIGIDESNNKLYLYGAAGYNYFPDEIDRISEELYSNSEYGKARGMTIEDVNSALNNPLEQMQLGGIYYYDGSWKTTGNLTTKLREIPTWNNIKANGTYTPDGANTEEALGEYILNGYHYYLNDDDTAVKNNANSYTAEITDIEKETIFGASTNYSYWLASRGVRAGSVYAGFGPGDVNNGDASSYGGTFYSYDDEGYVSAAWRPVVSLKSKLPEKK